MKKNNFVDLLVIFGVLAFMFFIGTLVGHDITEEQNRGCVASAYQATAHGFESDLEANLAVCYEGV